MEKKLFILSNESAEKLTNEQLSDKLFGGGHRVIGNLSLWAKANPARYKAVQQVQRDDGILDKTASEKLIEQFGPKEPRRLSVQELRARARVSRADVDRYYRRDSDGSADNLSKLKESNADRYQMIKLAHDSYATEAALVPKSDVTGRFVVTGALASAFNLPEAYAMDVDEFAELARLKQEHDMEVAKGAE